MRKLIAFTVVAGIGSILIAIAGVQSPVLADDMCSAWCANGPSEPCSADIFEEDWCITIEIDGRVSCQWEYEVAACDGDDDGDDGDYDIVTYVTPTGLLLNAEAHYETPDDIGRSISTGQLVALKSSGMCLKNDLLAVRAWLESIIA